MVRCHGADSNKRSIGWTCNFASLPERFGVVSCALSLTAMSLSHSPALKDAAGCQARLQPLLTPDLNRLFVHGPLVQTVAGRAGSTFEGKGTNTAIRVQVPTSGSSFPASNSLLPPRPSSPRHGYAPLNTPALLHRLPAWRRPSFASYNSPPTHTGGQKDCWMFASRSTTGTRGAGCGSALWMSTRQRTRPGAPTITCRPGHPSTMR